MLEFAQEALIYIVPYLLVLTLVVTVHELAHFWTARVFGTAVDRFSIGFGPKLFSWPGKNGMEWWISAIPLGGYVKFSGDENVSSVPDNEDLDALKTQIVREKGADAVNRYFHFKPVWQRALIVAAGPVSNFILATVIFAGILLAFGSVVTPVQVASVEPGGPAARAGFMPGDVVIRADGKAVRQFGDFQIAVAMHSGEPVDFVVRRGERELTLTATPEKRERENIIGGKDRIGVIGVEAVQGGPGTRLERYNPLEALAGGAARTWGVVDMTVTYIGRWISGAENGDQIRGPLGMAQTTGGVAKISAEQQGSFGERALTLGVNLLQMAAVISVAVGFINLLPIPMLDGGHLLFYAYEATARRPLNATAQAAGYRVGLALVLGLVLFATWNDLQQLRLFQLIGGAFS